LTFPSRIHFTLFLYFSSFISYFWNVKNNNNKLAPLLIQYGRLSQTSIGLNWQLSEGSTQYRLIQTYSNGTLIDSNDFGNVSSTNIYNLELLVQYLFTIYSGNSNGFDLSEGRGVLVSTDSSFSFSSIFFFLSFFPFYHFFSFHLN